MADNENAITPTPENPIPDVDEIKPGIPLPAWRDQFPQTSSSSQESK